MLSIIYDGTLQRGLAMSGESAVGTFVVMGGVYLVAEALAPFVAAAYVGVAVAYVVMAAVVVLGIITILVTIGRAVASRDGRWMLDILAAPLAASLSAWMLYPVYLKGINAFLGLLNGWNNHVPKLGNPDTIGGFFVNTGMILVVMAFILVISAVVAVAVIGAPIGAVYFMNFPDRNYRLGSYACYAFTAFYWQTAMFAISRGQATWN